VPASLRLGIFGFVLLFLVPAPPNGARGQDAQIAEDERTLKKAGLSADAAGLLRFVGGLAPAPDEHPRLAALVDGLGANDFRTRDRSWRTLLETGARALPALREGTKSPDLETKTRAERCIKLIEAPLHDVVPAALRLLQIRKPSGAIEALLDYVPCAVDELVVEEIHSTLVHLAPARGRDYAALVAALSSQDASRRGAAALTLACRGDEPQRKAVRALLRDSNPTVVFRAAQGLSAAGDKASIPTLIDLLESEGALGTRAEDLLQQMAGDPVPSVFLEEEQAARKKCRQAWENWWRARPAAFVAGPVDVAECASRRARAAVARFLRALFQGDFAALQKSSATPFSLAGFLTLQTQEEFDQLFKEVLEGHRKNRGNVSYQILRVTGRDQFTRSATQRERQFLDSIPGEEIRVVYFRGRFGDDTLEEGAALVRIRACRARVIGFGHAQGAKGL